MMLEYADIWIIGSAFKLPCTDTTVPDSASQVIDFFSDFKLGSLYNQVAVLVLDKLVDVG